MSLYREWNIDEHCLAAIWKIEEPEFFFITQSEIKQPDIKNERRRIEHLAGRFLLKHLKADFPLLNILPDEHDKPRVDDYFFSISHSYPYIATVVNPKEEAGIDIQVFRSGMENIQHKFLSTDEQKIFQNEPKLLTVAWCAKEAVYKWNGKRGVDFIKQLPITHFKEKGENIDIDILFKMNGLEKVITIEGLITEHFACCFVVNR